MVTRERFARWLHQGRGRAALVLEQSGDAAYREELLYAIHHDIRYELYSDGRAWYLHHLIARTPDPGWYRDRVLASLRSARRKHELWQLLDLAVAFAREGDREARQAARAAVETHLFRRLDGSYVRDWIESEGLDGFQFSLRLMEERKPSDAQDQFDMLLSFLGDPLRDEALALAKRFPYHSPLADRAENPPPRSPFPESGYRWARRASEEELAAAAAELTRQPGRDRLSFLLGAFRERPFPLSPEPLFAAYRSSDKRIRNHAAWALRLIRDSRVRDFALDLLRRRDGARGGIRILTGNYEPGDWRRVERVFRRRMTDAERHDALLSLVDLYESHPHPDAIPILIAAYREGPCEECRSAVVRALARAEAIPDWMREELPHDCESTVREQAQSDKMASEPCSDSPGF